MFYVCKNLTSILRLHMLYNNKNNCFFYRLFQKKKPIFLKLLKLFLFKTFFFNVHFQLLNLDFLNEDKKEKIN